MPQYIPIIGCINAPGQWIIDLGHDGMTAASQHAHSGMCHWGDRAAVVDLDTGDATVVCGAFTDAEVEEIVASARLGAEVQAAFA